VGADTLVILMAAGRLGQTCADLIAAGRPALEPAAIVQWAWTADQRSVVGTLADLPILAGAASIGSPATLVVGSVAALPGSRGQATAMPAGRALSQMSPSQNGPSDR